MMRVMSWMLVVFFYWSVQILHAQNLIENFSFENPTIADNTRLSGAPDDWEIVRENNVYIERPNPVGDFPPTDAQQRLTLGGTILIQQTSELIVPDALYTFEADILPDLVSTASSRGNLALRVYDGDTFTVLSRTEDFLEMNPPLDFQTWNKVRLEWDSSHSPETWGKPLTVVLDVKPSNHYMLDNVSLTKLPSTSCFRVVQSDQETSVDETGYKDSISISLLQQPVQTIRIDVQPDDSQIDIGAGAGNPVFLFFSTTDWEISQQVAVSAVDDDVSQGIHFSGITVTAVAPGDGSLFLPVKILDNEPDSEYIYNPSFEIPPVAEGAERRYCPDGWQEHRWNHGYQYDPTSTSVQPTDGDIRFSLYEDGLVIQKTGLTIEPDTHYTLSGDFYAYLLGDGANNTINIYSYGEDGISLLAASDNLSQQLPFQQWSPFSLVWESHGLSDMVGQKLAVGISIDSKENLNHFFYDSFSLTKTVDCGNLVFIDAGNLEVNEVGNTSDTYQIYLTKAPIADVLVDLSGGDQLNVSPSEVIFTSQNYNSPKSVTVTAKSDEFWEDIIHSGTVSHLTSSEDPDYDSISEQVSVLIHNSRCGSWGYLPSDLDHNCYVNLADFAILARQWFDCTNPQGANCDPVWFPQTIHASDFRFYYTYQTWGVFEIDSATHSASNPSNPLCIHDKVYGNGIGTHANSQVIIDLDGEFATFEAEIGIQCGNTAGSVIFQIYGDGQLLYDSGLVHESDPARSVSVSVEGLEELMLIVDDADDGITSDASNWANATLTYAQYPVRINPELHINVAPFARVVTWDPQLTGLHPSRIQELEPNEIFSEEDVVPDANGIYTVPVKENEESCIGLQWYENRKIRSMEIEYAEDSYIPPLEQIRLEWWVGESAWQGDWLPLSGSMIQDGRTLSYVVNATDTQNAISAIAGKNAGDIQKIRWVFPATLQEVKVNRFDVRTRSYWSPAVIRLFSEESISGQTAQLEMYNGLIESPDGQFDLTQTWDLSQPLELDVRYCASTFPPRSDRTILRIQLPDDKFGISIDDVVNNGTVYMPDFGVFATIEENFSPADYKTQISGKLNVLQQVRQMPDQSFTQAMAEVHQSIQDNGPTMLSLACDNEKYVVGQDGTVWRAYWPTKYVYGISNAFHISPVFDDGTKSFDNRSLENGWLPIVVNDVNYNNVIYHQRTGVAPYGSIGGNTAIDWLQPNPVGVIQFDIENTNAVDSAVSLKLNFTAPSDKSVSFSQVANGFIVHCDNLLWTYVQTENMTLTVQQQGTQLMIFGILPPHTTETLYAYIPGWDLDVSGYAALDDRQTHFDRIADYWHGIMSPAMQVQVPDLLLQNIIQASQVHMMLAARNEQEGVRVVPWCSADRYGPLESESQAVIHGMSMFGHQEFTRRSLDFFISQYNEDGLLTTGYTLMGLGWHLWTLGNDYMLFRNQDWLNTVAPDLEQACSWIVSEREKTKKLDGYGQKMPEYGIMPPGVAADWSRFAYRIRPQSEYYAGLCAVAQAYNDIQYSGSDVLLQKAEELKDEIRRAYLWTQARSPAIHLLNDHWVPYSPAFVTCFGPIGEMYPGEDGNRSWGKDVSMGAHHLVPLGLFGYDDQREIEWISNYLEDVWFLMAGMGAYPEDEVKENWFNLGGFYKVQPYYCRITELYAHKDDIKPFIRAYFNAIPTLINTENLTFWEHFANIGGWNKTHETGWFLKQTRQMLLMEKENDELWIAPFMTYHWMQDGMVVAVQNAPTEYGPVSFEIQSAVSQNQIHATIDLSSTRDVPGTLVVRLRHPDEISIKTVTVNGNPHSDFDPEREIIRVNPAQQQITITADY